MQQTAKSGLSQGLLAPPSRLELLASRLGGVRSIQLSYGGIYKNYSILESSGTRTICRLGGGPFIHLRYGGLY